MLFLQLEHLVGITWKWKLQNHKQVFKKKVCTSYQANSNTDSTHIVMHVCTHTHTCMLAHTHTCMLAHTHTHTHACLHTHTHTCTCLHTCMHAHTHTSRTAWRDEFWEIFSKTTACWLTERSRQIGKCSGEEGQVGGGGGGGGGQERNRNCFISHIVHSLFFQSESFCHQALLATLWNQLTNPVIIFILLLLPCLLCTNSKDSVDPDKRAVWWRKTILVTLKATFSNT